MKKLIALITACVLSISVLNAQKSNSASPENKAGERTTKMTKELGLSKEQSDKTYKVNLEIMKQRKAINDKYGNNKDQAAKNDELKKLKAEYSTKMKAILTDAQFTKFKELMKKQPQR